MVRGQSSPDVEITFEVLIKKIGFFGKCCKLLGKLITTPFSEELTVVKIGTTTLSIMTFSLMTFSLTALSIRSFHVTLSISDSQHQ